MKPVLIATLLGVASIMISLPVANALTPRSDFSDNVSTYRLFDSTKICGDHLCKPGEWNKWINNLFSSQIKKFSDLIGMKNPSSNTVKNTSYDTKNVHISSGDIVRINTFGMDGGRFTSFISVTNKGPFDVNHIAISQINPDVKVLKAWITPQWDSSIALYQTSFDTSKTSLTQGQTLNIVIVTDGKPAFSLDTLFQLDGTKVNLTVAYHHFIEKNNNSINTIPSHFPTCHVWKCLCRF